MSTRFTWQFKARMGLVAGMLGLASLQPAAAQFVPRTVILGPGVVVTGGADTARSAELRGQGQYQRGQGEYLSGAARWLQALGQYERDRQTSISMAMQNRSQYLALVRTQKLQREHDEQDRLLAARTRNEGLRLARLRDHASESVVQSGQSLNFLWEKLGSRVDVLTKQGVAFNAADLEAIRFQTAQGVTFDSLFDTLDGAGRVQWPEALRRSDLSDACRDVERAVAEAFKADAAGQPATSHFAAAAQRASVLKKQAGPRIARDGVAAWKIANEFCDRLLRTLNLASTGSVDRVQTAMAYRPQNTADLIRHMRANNLRFAPMNDGLGGTYRRLHTALANLDASTSAGVQVAGR